QWVASDCAVRGGLDDAFLYRGAKVLRDRAAENLVLEDEALAARKRLEDNFAVAKLSAPASLFLVASLHFCACRDRLLVRNFRRMQRYFDAVAFPELVNNC